MKLYILKIKTISIIVVIQICLFLSKGYSQDNTGIVIDTNLETNTDISTHETRDSIHRDDIGLKNTGAEIQGIPSVNHSDSTLKTQRKSSANKINELSNRDSLQNEEKYYSENADQWSQSLADELILNASQRDTVRAILIDYQRQRAALKELDEGKINEFNQTFNMRIQSVLEENQVKPFQNYAEIWWDDINSAISNSDQNSNRDNQQY